jgi:hypothetical protein
MDKDLELQVMYCSISEVKHELNYACQQLDLARAEVDTRTHVIVHLENASRRRMLSLRRGGDDQHPRAVALGATRTRGPHRGRSDVGC